MNIIDRDIRKEFESLAKKFPSIKHDWMFNYRSFSKQCDIKARTETLKTLQPWISLLELSTQWLAHLHISLFEATRKYPKKYIYRLFVPCVLTGTACVQGRAILSLVYCGLDSPARSILRSLIETLSICMVTTHYDDLCKRYYKSKSIKKANDFWFKEIAGGKLQNMLNEVERSEGFPVNLSKEMRRWFREESKVYSQTIHTSYLSAYLTSFPMDPDKRDIRKGIFGSIPSYSKRTISEATRFVWYFSRLGYNNILDSTKIKDKHIKTLTGKNKNGAAVIFGREVLSTLIIKYWAV